MHAININKVPASSGAEWLLRGFGLLGRAPLQLGLVSGALGLLAGLALLAVGENRGGLMVVQVGVAVCTALLLGGLVWAAREIEQGRQPGPGDLLQGLRADKAPQLLVLLLPQLLAAVLIIVLLLALVGKDAILTFVDLMTRMEGGYQPKPEDLKDFPAGRFLLWMLLLAVVALLTAFCTFTAYPQVMFGNHGPLAAMRASLQACLRNLGALLVFFLLLGIAFMALNVAVTLVAGLVSLLAGQAGMVLVAQTLTMAVLMPVMAGASHAAWRQLHGDAAAADPTSPPLPGGQIEA